jgi:hypothetical protein
MNKNLLVTAVFACLFTHSCASQDYNMQKGAAIGAVGGALAGQAIGRNTAGTLIGAAGGALVGAVAGNAVDQSNTQGRLAQASPPPPTPVPVAPPAQEAPPGEWVEVPGTWVDGKWVAPHRAWVPVNPGGQITQGVPPPPVYAAPAPPEVVPVPGTYVYFVPGIQTEILFYRGYWYRPFGGRWYGAPSYNGPWVHVPPPRVPRALVALPPGWRRAPSGYRPIPHGELQRNWARWERERHWEHRRDWRR